MAIKKVEYIAKCDSSHAGVENKIKNTVNAIGKKVSTSEACIVNELGIKGTISIIRRLLSSDAELIILRSLSYNLLLAFPFLLFKRLIGTKLILDIPTPAVNQVHEILESNMSTLGRYIRVLLLYITFPISSWPFNKVFQYAPESPYFLLGCKKKTKLIANGIDVSNVDNRASAPPWPSKTLSLIGVGSLAFWHGYSRVLVSLAEYECTSRRADDKLPEVHFIIVGEGDSRKELELLAESLKIMHLVEFTGYLVGTGLNAAYERSHIGIATLAGYKKGLTIASELKAREYACKGLPFVMALQDIDFGEDCNFVKHVQNDDSTINIVELIEWYSELVSLGELSKIRQYAETKLDFTKKINDFIEV